MLSAVSNIHNLNNRHQRTSAVPVPRTLTLAIHAAWIGLSIMPVLASAQSQNTLADTVLPAVTVRDTADGYDAKQTSTATKTDSLIRDIPQSITVVTQDLMHDQQMQSMADVVRYVPGIAMANGEGNRDSPIFRGINSASGDMYIDGVRDDVEYYRDLYNISSVEALTGPNAMIFGRGGSGGVINRVSKQADWTSVREAQLALGSYNSRRLSADLGGAVNSAMAARVNALYHESDGFQRNFHQKREGINPTVALAVGERTLVNLSYEYFKDERVADRGIPSFKGLPLNLPVDAFFGDPDPATRPTHVEVNAVTGLITHDFGNGVILKNRTRYTYYDKFYQNYNAGAVNTAGTAVAISAYNNHQWRDNTFNQTDVTGTVITGGVKHRLLGGMELGQQNTDYLRKTGVFTTFNNATTVNIPLATSAMTLPVNYVLGASTSDRDARSEASLVGVYVQDQIELSPQFQVIAGLRHDNFNLDYHDNVTGSNLSSRDSQYSPRIGVVYKPIVPVSIYGNYSIAYFPRGGDQLSSLTAANQKLDPEKFENYEVGVKWDVTPRLSSRIAVYRLNRTNVAVADPLIAGQFDLVDGQRTNGVEIGLSGNVTSAWSVMGGYAYQDSKLTATTSAAAANGAVAAQVPKSTFSLWNRYDFTPSWGAGLGVICRTDMFASTSNAVTLPGYTRVDGALFYRVDKNISLQMNVENLMDRKYFASANNDNNITPGSPRTVRVALNLSI